MAQGRGEEEGTGRERQELLWVLTRLASVIEKSLVLEGDHVQLVWVQPSGTQVITAS